MAETERTCCYSRITYTQPVYVDSATMLNSMVVAHTSSGASTSSSDVIQSECKIDGEKCRGKFLLEKSDENIYA